MKNQTRTALPVVVSRIVRLARWLSAWAWKDETAALRRASILREIANRRINENPANESWWLGVLEGAAHCQTGESIGFLASSPSNAAQPEPLQKL